MIRKTYNKYYNKKFDFPLIINKSELNIFIETQLYFDDTYKENVKLKNEDDNIKLLELDIYKKFDRESILTTLDYIFNKLKTGIFVKIENNQLSHFITLYNVDYENDFSEQLKFKEGNVHNYYKEKQKYYKNKISKINTNLKKWNSINCLLRNELEDYGATERYLIEFYDMINKTCRNRVVNNCIFFINRKDFPNLKKDYTEPDEHIWDREDKKLNEKYINKTFVPILTQSSKKNFCNLLIPTGDDWDFITNQFEEYKRDENFKLLDWKDRKNCVIWRGMGTGCGNDFETNMRLKLSKLSQTLNKDYLDAGIVKLTKRDKKLFNKKYVEFQKDIDIKYSNYIDRYEQMNYKFTINIEGNSSAYRYGSLFNLGFCILNVESDYKLWFEQWLIPYTHYIPIKHNLDDLEEKIKWCLDNDDKCYKISKNAMEFYNKYFNKDFIYDYLSNLFNTISNKYDMKNMTPIYLEDYIKKGLNLYKDIKCDVENINMNDMKIQINNKNTIIIVPYRDNKFQDRKKQLELFKKHYENYNVLIVEQSDDNRKFNRGALLNIGFLYCYKNYDYIIFHDVDILTPHDIINKCYFVDIKGSLHLGNITNKCIGCNLFFGAINKFDVESFKKINGFPNTFWGWGDEDVVLFYRCCYMNVNIYKPKLNTIVKELEHTNTNKIKELTNLTRYEKRIYDIKNYNIDGLLNTNYYIVNTINDNNYKKITVIIK